MALNEQLIKRAGFAKAGDDDGRRRLILCTEGMDGSGKDHFALTAPGPIFIANWDEGLEGVVEKFARGGVDGFPAKDIRVKPYTLDRTKMGQDAVKAMAAKVWDESVEDYRTALKAGFRTVIVDTACAWHKALILAQFGKDVQILPHFYNTPNAIMASLVREAYATDCNVVFLHKVKKQYKQNKEGKDSWTGAYDRAGWSDMRFACQAALVHWRNEDGFGATITKFRHGADYVGMDLSGDTLSFPFLATLAFPETGVEDWL